ncbi:serine hydrolase domain-containing protein [Nocardiopsis potens]|uniref:serine hydrolase domain-containing protein n=1 Tax=Nocardiopsis potens TaxID=1246458 RepID=UPI000348F176|nr:serine hydrolase domain-containing protein [Nocardiopsis potens]
MWRSIGRSASALGAVLVLAAGAGPAAAEEDPGPPRVDEEGVRAFLDRRVPELLEEFDVPGAAVSVVAGGEQVFAQGYGVADLETGEPVVAEEAAFPTASVAKSFTALAVLRLAEEGRLDLHADVNGYLPEDLRIDDAYPGDPVTLHHLLTHTAGLEEAVVGTAVSDYAEESAAERLRTVPKPDRVEPPGRFSAYSNYGYDLLGVVVEEAEGKPFADAARELVFEPLGMDRSAFTDGADAAERFPVPTLYRMTPDGNAPDRGPVLAAEPAGGAFAPVTDMSRFMLALLGGGELDGERVLPAGAVEAMLDRQAANEPRLTGSGYGTWERSAGSPRTVGHGGDLGGLHTEYALVPEEGVGVYVAVNGDGDGDDPINDMRALVVHDFLAEFTGAGTDRADGTGAAGADPDRYTGTYVTTRTSRGDAASLKVALDQVSVVEDGGGALRTESPALPDRRWIPVEPGLYREDGGNGGTLVFIEEDGAVAGLGFDENPTQAYRRVPWYGQPNLHLAAAGAALPVMASALVWPAAGAVRRLRGRRTAAPRGSRAALLAAGLAAAACTGFTAFVGYLLVRIELLEALLFTGSPLLVLPLAAAVPLAAVAVAAAVPAWRRGWWSRLGRVHYSAVVLASAVFLSIAAFYGLVWSPVPG